jgi:hypothetical protein
MGYSLIAAFLYVAIERMLTVVMSVQKPIVQALLSSLSAHMGC